jgi:hypothetical protein
MASLALSYEVETGVTGERNRTEVYGREHLLRGQGGTHDGQDRDRPCGDERVASDRHPDTICEVVHEGPHRESWKTRGKAVMRIQRESFFQSGTSVISVGTVMASGTSSGYHTWTAP